jgi:hypothetical protein
MVGHRNASVMISNKGEITKLVSCDLGFIKIIDEILMRTSGLATVELTSVIINAGKDIEIKALKKLARSSDGERQILELQDLQKAIEKAKKQYCSSLFNWLNEVISQAIDEIVIAGGTAEYLKQEIRTYFHDRELTFYWHSNVNLNSQFDDELGVRLVDIFCLYYYFLDYLNKKS